MGIQRCLVLGSCEGRNGFLTQRPIKLGVYMAHPLLSCTPARLRGRLALQLKLNTQPALCRGYMNGVFALLSHLYIHRERTGRLCLYPTGVWRQDTK